MMAGILKDTPCSYPCLSLVIPVYNEVATLRQIIERVREALAEVPHDIVLVDDGSTDGTQEIVARLGEQGMRTFRHDTNRGKGAALRTGFAACRGEIVVVQDADLEYDPRDIPRLVQPIIDGKADVVIGSRFHGEAQRVQLYWHRVGCHWALQTGPLMGASNEATWLRALFSW